MCSSLTTRRKWVISFSEFIGLILSLFPTIWVIANGGLIEDTFINIAFTTLRLALILRSIHVILVFTTMFIIILLTGLLIYLTRNKRLSQNINFNSDKWFVFRVLIGLYLGYMLGKILFYLLLNSIFYRNVFVTIPFFLGSALFIGVLGLIFGNPELTQKVIDLLNKAEKSNDSSISRLRLVDSLGKVIIFILIALLLIIPNTIPLFGTLPTPPDDPAESYLNITDNFSVQVIKLEHTLPSNIRDLVESENSDSKWYTYIYLPHNEMSSNQRYPVAFYLHGFTGIDIELYHSSMKNLAERGVIGIFVQYATFINLQGEDAELEFDHPADNPELYVRYTMEWSGITQAVAALNLNTNAIGSQTLLDNLGTNYTIDFSRLMIIGHSMGGGMVPYIATKSLEQGWGGNELILDMEAPWYASTWSGFQPNYQIMPSNLLLNIVTYEDDHAVSQCIGMDFFERIRLSNGTNVSDTQLNFVYLYSDFHGFPRLLASHYVPTDPLDDPVHQYGYKKRINAMAYFLFHSSQGSVIDFDTVKQFFLGVEVENMGKWSDGKAVKKSYSTDDPYGIRGDPTLVDQLQDTSDELCKTDSA